MQVVHGYRNGKNPKQRVVSTMGRYDESRYLNVQEILRDMQRLKRMQEVISEINDPAVPPDTGHNRKFSLRWSCKTGR
ncbi:MAG: transposase [Peptococcaceae bacterium]|jgi:hypothetical protein|nr:transposase [Peptococcaceae bacterium]MDH7526191.1 transposase [Peptococcaceae bacterium]